MISREKFLEATVRDMLVTRAQNAKDFWQLNGGDLVNMAEQAYRAMVDAHLRDLVPGRSPSEFLESLVTNLDNMGAKGRRTFIAFLGERYDASGERRGPRE